LHDPSEPFLGGRLRLRDLPNLFCDGIAMKMELLVMTFLFAIIGLSEGGLGGEDFLKKRFLSEYPEAMKAWEARFSNAVGTVMLIQDDSRRNPPTHGESLYKFKCKLPGMAIVSRTMSSEGSQQEMVSGYNKDYAFKLKRAVEAADFSILSLESAKKASQVPFSSPVWHFVWLPYATHIENFRLVSSPRFVVQAVTSFSRNGRSLLKIEFDYPNDPKHVARKGFVDNGGYEGYFVVSPEEKWVLYEYESRQKKGKLRSTHKGTVEYEGTSDGFPIPKRAVSQTFDFPEGKLFSTHSYEFQRFMADNVPDGEFALAAFGIPEEVSQPAKVARSRGLGYLFLALALVALVAAVLFRVASSRLKKASIS
jgi:hypothetical protein